MPRGELSHSTARNLISATSSGQRRGFLSEAHRLRVNTPGLLMSSKSGRTKTKQPRILLRGQKYQQGPALFSPTLKCSHSRVKYSADGDVHYNYSSYLS